ncbi:MAG: CsgG/HfaB family protein [Gemmatimonadota bacterium]
MRSLCALGLAVLIAGVAAPLAAQTPVGPRLRVGVMDLSGTALSLQTGYTPTTTTTTIAIPPPAEFARGLTEMLTTALVETGRFVVLERKAIEQVLSEQDFGAGGRVNTATAPAVGQAIGAQVLITGDITEFTYQQSSLGGNISILRSVGATGERLTAMVALDIRLLDAVTGEVVFSKRTEGKASATGVSADIKLGDQQFGTAMGANTPLGKASREAIEDAVEAVVEGMRKVPWSGRVVDVRDAAIYVNAGAESGIALGTAFDVFVVQEALVDPETGLNLGAPDRQIGSLVVTEVADKYAVARATAGEGFQRGDLIRLTGQSANP